MGIEGRPEASDGIGMLPPLLAPDHAVFAARDLDGGEVRREPVEEFRAPFDKSGTVVDVFAGVANSA